MMPAMNIALSGLNAAERRLSVSANNTANMSTTGRVENGVRVSEPYTPQRVQQVSQGDGGVRADVSASDPATYPVYNPADPGADANGIVRQPNVSPENEAVNQITATYDFKANLKTMKAQDTMAKSLLDILT